MPRFLYLLYKADTVVTELGSALGLGLCWGFWLMLPFDTFSTARVYAPMVALAPEPVWGIGLCLIGLAQSAAIVQGSLKARHLVSILALAAWSFILVMFLVGNALSIGVAFYILYVVASVWVTWRLGNGG
jgi:hypothetical protein